LRIELEARDWGRRGAEKGAGVSLWERLLAGPIAPQATSTRRKDAFSTPAVEQVVSALGLIGVRLGGGKGAHLATRQVTGDYGDRDYGDSLLNPRLRTLYKKNRQFLAKLGGA